MKTFKLHLIRHGLTEGNLNGLYLGSGTDLPLCPAGWEQLAGLAARFAYPQVGTVFTSPLLRCTQTAQLLFPAAQHTYELQDLREAGFGVFDGKPIRELMNDPDFAKWMQPGSGFLPEGAEPTAAFHTRCGEALLKLFEFMIKSGIEEAACVTHGGVIMSMLAQHALPQRPAEQWMADPGCGYTVQTTVPMWMRDRLVEAVQIQPLGYLDAADEAAD